MPRGVCFALALIVAHVVRAEFERPSANDRLGALGNLFEESAVLRPAAERPAPASR